jgi:hypothetical protein
MTGVHNADNQSLTQDQQLIRMYRTASPSVRHQVNVLLGLREPDKLEEGQVESDEPAGSITGKRRLSSNEATAPKRPRLTTGPSLAIDFNDLKNPDARISCAIQVDSGPLIGSLDMLSDGVSVALSLDAGCFGSPSITLSFKSRGSRGLEVANLRWAICDRADSEWVMRKLAVNAVHANRHVKEIQHPQILRDCPTWLESQLFCISLNLRGGYQNGFVMKDAWKSTRPDAQKRDLKKLCGGRDGYDLQIWFINRNERRNIQSECLSIIQGMFDQLSVPLATAQDSKGEFFILTPSLQRPGARPTNVKVNTVPPLRHGVQPQVGSSRTGQPGRDNLATKPPAPTGDSKTTFALSSGAFETARDRSSHEPELSVNNSVPAFGKSVEEILREGARKSEATNPHSTPLEFPTATKHDAMFHRGNDAPASTPRIVSKLIDMEVTGDIELLSDSDDE